MWIVEHPSKRFQSLGIERLIINFNSFTMLFYLGLLMGFYFIFSSNFIPRPPPYSSLHCYALLSVRCTMRYRQQCFSIDFLIDWLIDWKAVSPQCLSVITPTFPAAGSVLMHLIATTRNLLAPSVYMYTQWCRETKLKVGGGEAHTSGTKRRTIFWSNAPSTFLAL